MPITSDAAHWVAPPPPTSVVPAEALDVGEPQRVGAIELAEGSIEINAGRETKQIEFTNTGDRPVQIGAHCHLFEVNRVLAFDREAAFGYRLDIPSGSSVRFEPGQTRKCQVTRFGGVEVSRGMNDLTNGSMRSELTRASALDRARRLGYRVEEAAP